MSVEERKKLCSTCEAPNTIPAFGEHPDVLKNISGVKDELMPLLFLHATASTGCIRCAIILEAAHKWKSSGGELHHVKHPEQYVIGIAPMPRHGAKAARTGAVGLTVAVTLRNGWEHYGYLAWSRNDYFWEFDVRFDLYTECGTSIA